MSKEKRLVGNKTSSSYGTFNPPKNSQKNNGVEKNYNLGFLSQSKQKENSADLSNMLTRAKKSFHSIIGLQGYSEVPADQDDQKQNRIF